MERRYLGSNATSSHHSSTSHILRPTNSFIPTSASGHGHHGHGNALPHPSNPTSKIHVHQSTTNLQQQPQAPSQQQIPPPQSHNYYNGGSNHTGTLGHHVPPSVQHHHQQQQQQLIQHQQQQLQYHQRAMTKSYSTTHYNNGAGANNTLSSNNIHHHHHHHQSQQQQHFYGTTTSHHPNGNAINGHGQQQQQQPPPPSQHSLPPPQSVHHPQQQQQPQPPPSQQYPIPQSHQTYITTTGNNNNNNGLITNPPYHHNNTTHYQVSETEGLPPTLVESMRTLFDILDDTKQGKIRLSDIESRWEADPNGTNGKATGAEPLIKMGVMGYLRKVTPADGMLTFERFCAGLRLALLTNNDNNNNHNNSTTNNHSSLHNPPIHHQFQQQLQLHQQQQQHPPPPPPPQQQLLNNFHHPQQQQILVKASSVTSNSHSVSSNSSTHAILNNSSNGTNHTYSQSNSNTLPASAGGSKSMLSLQGNQIPASNTMHRTSKIPSLSTSRLPMPSNGSSGIPVSPNNRLNATYMSTTNSSPSTATASAIPPPNGTMTNGTSGVENHHGNHQQQQHRSGGTVKRGQPATPEQGTTVAIVHYQPKTPGIPSYSASSGTLKLNKQSSSALGSSAKYTAKNGSLDNLKSPLEEKLSVTGTKERPPSAPLLDNEPDPKPSSTLLVNHSTVKTTVNHHRTSNHTTTPTSHSHSSNATSRRERARSRDRDREERNKSSDDITNDDGSKRISYVSPRQRTLSMPQLQLSKLKPKSIVSIEDPSSPPSAGKTNNVDKGSLTTTNALKSNKSLPLIAPSFVSAIPTIGMTSKIQQHHHHQQQQQSQKIDISPSASANSSNAGGTVERESHNTLIVTSATIKEKEQPPPPPKPPRNGLNGPIIITTNLVNNEIIVSDVPHSGGSSSTMSGSGLSTSNASTGTNNNSSGNNNPSKPEIRSALQTWQKGLSEKKPLESTLSTASTVNSLSAISIISNSTSKSAAPPPSTGKNDSNSNNIPPTNENDVKLRANNNGKGNARRRETPRRHTVQSGIDFATLKRLKQLEQERDVLQQGITYLDKAKEWYKKQLEGAEEKIALLSKGAPASEYWSESHEERLNLLGCRVSEVNSLLTALMDGSSLPLHMNLQIPTHLSLRTITRLKEQNRQLTQEVSECGHRVTQLEAEKAMLLRQLFHQKNSNHSEETVYM